MDATKQDGPGRGSILRGLILEIESRLEGGDMKATVGDYIRLIQLERELASEDQREVRLRWVEPTVTTSES